MNGNAPSLLVFSDLDGSLLDHHSYSFAPALPLVKTLAERGIPLILASSKTRAEMLELRLALGNTQPFIVVNGAAVFIPRHTFPAPPVGTRELGDYWVYEMAPARSKWLALLADLSAEFPGEFDSFHSAGVAGIVEMTGLSMTQAQAANDRFYSEPVRWLGSKARETLFTRRLRDAGATVLKGGRFLSVSGNCDKGQALRWLRARYQQQAGGTALKDLAIGDSENDCSMLEAAHTALLIRSPVHDFPALGKVDGVLRSSACGPAGWAQGVSQWLQSNGIST